jgi:hypothetical protein
MNSREIVAANIDDDCGLREQRQNVLSRSAYTSHPDRSKGARPAYWWYINLRRWDFRAGPNEGVNVEEEACWKLRRRRWQLLAYFHSRQFSRQTRGPRVLVWSSVSPVQLLLEFDDPCLQDIQISGGRRWARCSRVVALPACLQARATRWKAFVTSTLESFAVTAGLLRF